MRTWKENGDVEVNVRVEFTGLAESLTGLKQTDINLENGATYRDIIRMLGVTYPSLIGILIAEDRETFLSSNMFVIDGDYASPAMDIDQTPRDGEHLYLMSVITGG